MSKDEILAQVKEIFLDVMDLDDVTLTEATTADDIDEWDSLSHVRLMVAIEQEFGLRFTNAEIESFKCVGDLVTAIQGKTA